MGQFEGLYVSKRADELAHCLTLTLQLEIRGYPVRFVYLLADLLGHLETLLAFRGLPDFSHVATLCDPLLMDVETEAQREVSSCRTGQGRVQEQALSLLGNPRPPHSDLWTISLSLQYSVPFPQSLPKAPPLPPSGSNLLLR